MAATLPGDKLDGPQGTPDSGSGSGSGSGSEHAEHAEQAQQNKAGYKAMLDKAADEARAKRIKDEAGQPDGLVSKIVDQVSHVLPESGKKMLGAGHSGHSDPSGPSGHNDDGNGDGAEGIPKAAVKEFIRDVHGSQRVSPQADERLQAQSSK